MKKTAITVLAIFATAIPASISASIAFTARCANGNYAVQTVEPEFFEGQADLPPDSSVLSLTALNH